MPSRQLVAKELAELFKVVSHPDRIRMIEELRSGEKDVNTLMETLELPGPRVSQHLSLLRAHRFVEERRDGRHHFYHLTQPEIAEWIIEGLSFIEGRMSGVSRSAIKSARELWSTGAKSASNSS
ncbi:MAG: metalloregulator ArsR/SmtB family transcription factor [Pseudomonadota bacterium]